MAQGSTVLPTTGTVSGATMAADMNTALEALKTCFSGASAPSADAPEEGQFWLDTSTAFPTMRQYTGSAWVPLFVLDTTNGKILPPSGPFATTTGTSSAYVLTTTPYQPTSLWDGMKISLLVHTANAGACTININGLGAHPLRSASAVDLSINTLVANSVIEVTYLLATTEFVMSGFFAGSSPVPPGVSMEYAGFTAPTGYYMEYGQAVSRSGDVPLFSAITLIQNGTLTNGAKSVTGLTDTSNMRIGHPIEGSHLLAGTTIASIVSSTAITVSQNATGSLTESLTVFPWGNGNGTTTANIPDHRGVVAVGNDAMGGTAANKSQVTTTITSTNTSATATVGSATGLAIGMVVNTANFPYGTTILTISGTTLTLSNTATATGSAAVRFSPLNDAQILGSVGGSMTHVQVISEVPSHTHAASSVDSGHTHTAQIYINSNVVSPGAGTDGARFLANSTSTGFANITTTITAAGGGNGFLTYDPKVVKNFIIKR